MTEPPNVPPERLEEIVHRMVRDRTFRFWLCSKSFYWFCQFYFHQLSHAPTPEFHRQIMDDLQNLKDETYVLAAGRGMGKSTLTRCYILWQILCRGEKFVVFVSETDRQVSQLLENAQGELEDNEQLLRDFGPIKKISDKWGRTSGLEVGNYGAKIIAASIEQGIRSMSYRHHRPGLFVFDDVESSASVKSVEMREKLRDRYERDFVPAGAERTKILILGGLLHPLSFVSHMKKIIQEGKTFGFYREYPFLDVNGVCLWPERYPTPEAIDRVRRKSGSDKAFRQEYLLQPIIPEDQIVKYEWLEGQDYDEMPGDEHFLRTVISVDPASSKKETADFTAIVVFNEYCVGDKKRIYILPNPINERLSGMEIEERILSLYALHGRHGPVQVLVETTSQNYLTERLMKKGVNVRECRPKGDKHDRLMMAAAPVQAKLVFFHRTGCEELKQQLLGFGYTNHDDLVDSFSQGINEMAIEEVQNLDVIVLG